MRTDLNVPYSEKDEAKRLGARWDGIKRTWYVVSMADLRPFMRWMPAHLIRPVAPEMMTRQERRKARREQARRELMTQSQVQNYPFDPLTNTHIIGEQTGSLYRFHDHGDHAPWE